VTRHLKVVNCSIYQDQHLEICLVTKANEQRKHLSCTNKLPLSIN